MSEQLYLTTLCLPLVTILLVFGMRYFSASQQANARLANDDAYRRVAEQAVAAQAESAAVLSAIQASVADIGSRVIVVENILKAVE